MPNKMSKKLWVILYPENRRQLFWMYTGLYFITLLLSFLPFFIWNVSFLRIDTDGFLQHYDALVQMKRVIHQVFTEGSFSFWSWNIGLGADSIGTLGYVFFNPFNYIAVMFPEQYLSVGYTIAIYLELYVAGLGFLYFGKATGLSHEHSLWGALAYAFSAWIIGAAAMHSFFGFAMVLFVFIMAGVEKVLRKQSPLVLILTVAISLIENIYFSYMTAILVLLYLVIYFIAKEKKTLNNFIHFWGGFILYVGIAVCLAAVILFPSVYILMNAVKDGATDYSLFYPVSVYIHYFSCLLGGQEIFGQYSRIQTTALFILFIPAVLYYVRKKQATPGMVTFLFCLLFLFFPFFNSVFNGLSYPVGRWCYGATFFYIWSGIQCLEKKDFDIKKYQKSILVMLLFFEFMLIFAGRIILTISGNSLVAGTSNNEIHLMNSVINLFCAAWIYWLLADKLRKRKLKNVLITLALICNIAAINFIQFFPGVSGGLNLFARQGEIYHKFENATQRAGTEIRDNDFYRIDQVDFVSNKRAEDEQYLNSSIRFAHRPGNETLVFNTRSIYTYFSTTAGSLFDFYKNMGVNASYSDRVFTYGNDNRTRLDFLHGVKYFLGDNPNNIPSTGAEEYASYAFAPAQISSQGVEILKNKYSMGLGSCFDSYITESEWLQLDYPDREQALMESVVLADEEETALTHADYREISSGAVRGSYHIASSNACSGGGVLFPSKKRKTICKVRVSSA